MCSTHMSVETSVSVVQFCSPLSVSRSNIHYGSSSSSRVIKLGHYTMECLMVEASLFIYITVTYMRLYSFTLCEIKKLTIIEESYSSGESNFDIFYKISFIHVCFRFLSNINSRCDREVKLEPI